MNDRIKIGISPCPNDIFIFYALMNNKVNCPFDFDFLLADVEVLNKKVLQAEMDICKLSFNAFGHVTHEYQLLDSGAALGNNCGPILIKLKDRDVPSLSEAKIAIPGKFTTANLLLNMALPHAQNKIEILFSDIEKELKSQHVDLGLIIHETRFTYVQNGFEKIMDLGEYWESTQQCPLPLGGIVCRRNLPIDKKKEFSKYILKSIQYANQNEPEVLAFCKKYAQEMNTEVMKQHINLFVNNYSKSLGKIGKKSVQLILSQIQAQNNLSKLNTDLFAPIWTSEKDY